MSSAGTSDGGGRAWGVGVWPVPIAGLAALWLWLAFSSGGYIASQWLPASLALGLFGLVVALLGAFPRRPGQLSLAVLVIFGLYAVWVALSALWAESATRVWMESGRTFTYLLVFALALVFFTDQAARRSLRYIVVAATLVLFILCVVKLWATNNIAAQFFDNRFFYPVSAPNQAGALFLIAFWPLMWLASSPEERSPVRGVALGIATGLLGLAVMTQSRGAIWSLALAMVFMFIVSPARLRLLFYLVVPLLLMVYEFPTLDRYWREGPEAVGGHVGARTVLVAAIIAGFIGMIVALLERWVKVSRRMKAIFGTVILAGVIAACVFWTATSTSDVGGPVKWLSQAWQQFTSTQHTGGSEDNSRFGLISSTGRVQIWRVAVKEFEDAPLRGAGADNFVLGYYRYRTTESFKPQQAHSLELQVLSETGSIGGGLLFFGIVLSLGACLWPRCVAGWRGARATWLRRGKTGQAGTSQASARWCKPRWGDDPSVYGWQMALLAGAAYWFIHGSVDWIWQMAGLTIPAFLFLAAALASVDARVGVVWPRLERWLKVGGPPGRPVTTDQAPQAGGAVRDSSRSLLFHVFRAALVALSAVLLLVAGLPYLSLQFQNSALALANTDPARAVGRAAAARYLVPTDPAPYETEATIYDKAAKLVLASGGPAAAGAVLDNLALAESSCEEAISQEPADWTLHYQAGLAVIDLMLARGYSEGWPSIRSAGTNAATVVGVGDWSALSGAPNELASPGLTPGSLATNDAGRANASTFRTMSTQAMLALSLKFFDEARERNPLGEQIEGATALARQVAGLGQK